MKYHAIYITTNSSGHSKQIATTGQDESAFPANIEYDGANYRFQNSYQVGTPSQQKNFIKFCEDNHIETEVYIN